ncbi:VOC family protein [Haloparvum sedimenti]|uniref:VOC family protein n=1 Tax=Haloparvum sedimenti TaxID=1678448 RepID=UPI00071E7959|nr:VOC family protein [Haloparvum sedimenti]
MNSSAHHVGVTVSNLDRAVAFYRDELGLDVLSEFSVGGEGFADAVDVPGASAEFAHLDAGDVRLELVAYGPSGEPRGDSALNRPGATHVGLSVPDVDAAYDELSEAVETLSEPRTTESGTRICFLRDPDGNLVELLDA